MIHIHMNIYIYTYIRIHIHIWPPARTPRPPTDIYTTHIHIYQYVYTYRYVYAPPHVSLNNLAHVVGLDQLVNKHLGEAGPQRRWQILLAHVRRRVHARK